MIFVTILLLLVHKIITINYIIFLSFFILPNISTNIILSAIITYYLIYDKKYKYVIKINVIDFDY